MHPLIDEADVALLRSQGMVEVDHAPLLHLSPGNSGPRTRGVSLTMAVGVFDLT